MIVFTIDDQGLIKQISKALGDYHAKAPTVLKQALNATAKDARKMLAEKAQDVYVVQKSKFNKAMTIKNASNSRLTAIIKATGEPLELISFKTNPRVPGTSKGVTTAKALVASSMKPLVRNDISAFIAKFKSGHIAVVQRRGRDRLPVKKLFSSSIPKMVGDEKRVYGIVQPQIAGLLDKNIHKYINKTIGKAN